MLNHIKYIIDIIIYHLPIPIELPLNYFCILAAPPLQCQWPSEMKGSRCVVVVTDQLLRWEEAQNHCR